MNRKRRFLAGCLTLIALGAVGWFAVSYFTMSEDEKPRPVGQVTPAPEGEGWINLLDAEHVAGWRNITDENDIFSIADGVLHIPGSTLPPLRYVAYEPQRFDHFDLHLEFKMAPRCNSGLFLRMQPNDPVYRGFEVQVQDDHGKLPGITDCGSIYDVVTPMFQMANPAGEWNSYDITVDGHRVVIVFNGWKVVDTDFSLMTTPLGKFDAAYAQMRPDGLLAFQDHMGEAWFRNILIRPRPAPADYVAPPPHADAVDAQPATPDQAPAAPEA